MLLSIIIVSYNTKDLTIQTIESVFSQLKADQRLMKNSELIVVDNNSTDNSILALQELLIKTSINNKLIKNKKNMGFAQANNQAIKISKGQFIFLLNSDTQLKPHAIKNLLKTFKQFPDDETTANLASQAVVLDKLGIVAAALYNPDGSYQPQGGSYPSLVTVFSQMFFLDDLPIIGQLFPSTQHTGLSQRKQQNKQLQLQDWVGGAAMLIKRSLLEEIGLFDENIFMYAEDLELCLRAKNHHYDIAIQPEAKVVHYGSASSSSANALIGEVKGLIYLWGKHKPSWQMPLIKTILQLGCLMRIALFSLLAKTNKVKTYQKILKEIY